MKGRRGGARDGARRNFARVKLEKSPCVPSDRWVLSPLMIAKTIRPLVPLAALGALIPLFASAQSSVTTDAVGFIRVDLTAGADNFVSLPLMEAPEFEGSIASASAGQDDAFTLDLNSSLSVSNDAWANSHYVRFTSGAADGKFFTVTANDSGSVTIDSIGDDLSGVAQGDTLKVVEYWTLAKLFPPESQDALVESTGDLGFQRGSEVLMPDVVGDGINRAPSDRFYVTDSEWRESPGGSNADDIKIMPDKYIIIRQDESASDDMNLVLSGTVPNETINTFIVKSNQKQDNYLSHGRPVGVSLNELGLGSAFEDSGGDLGFQREDELLYWDSPSGINPAPDKRFYRVNGSWREAPGGANAGSFVLESNSAFVIRKSSGNQTETVEWKNEPSY